MFVYFVDRREQHSGDETQERNKIKFHSLTGLTEKDNGMKGRDQDHDPRASNHSSQSLERKRKTWGWTGIEKRKESRVNRFCSRWNDRKKELVVKVVVSLGIRIKATIWWQQLFILYVLLKTSKSLLCEVSLSNSMSETDDACCSLSHFLPSSLIPRPSVNMILKKEDYEERIRDKTLDAWIARHTLHPLLHQSLSSHHFQEKLKLGSGLSLFSWRETEENKGEGLNLELVSPSSSPDLFSFPCIWI